MKTSDFAFFGGSASRQLAVSIARTLDHPVNASVAERFPDGEQSVYLKEPVRGHPVFVVQSLSPPVTENLFELLLFIDACRRAASGRITALVPYLGYARSDRRHACREPIAASLVANTLRSTGLNHLVTVDLHSAQIEGFYHLPVDVLTAVPTLCDALRHRLPPDIVVVSPDEGRIKMASEYGQLLNAPVAISYKTRRTPSETKVIKIVGEVHNRFCLIVDDMITTGGTIASTVAGLLEAGARPEITVAATHGVLLKQSRGNLSHPALREIFVTDSIAPHYADWPQLKVVTIAPLLAAAVQRLASRESISDLFQ